MGAKNQNDKIDAKAWARMGLDQRLPLWQLLSPIICQLRLLTRQQDFNKQRITLLNHEVGLKTVAPSQGQATR